MNSLRHVFWRGAMALSFLTLGIGSGFGFREVPVQASNDGPACDAPALRVLAPAGIDKHATDGSGTGPARIDALRDVALELRTQGTTRRG